LPVTALSRSRWIWPGFAYYREVLARHDIPVSRRLLVEEMQEIWASGMIRKCCAASSLRASPLQAKPGDWYGQLRRALDELDSKLDRLVSKEGEANPCSCKMRPGRGPF
jgi:hypothetical protein